MPASKNHKFVGRTLGNYQIEYMLDYSQWGAACLARHLAKGQRSMLTILKVPEGFSTRQWETRFAQEAATLVRFSHPNILPNSDFGIQPGYVYLVTDFVKDPSLTQALQESGYFTAQQIVPLLNQIASGLDYVHSHGITHGMLSPSHLLMRSGQTVRIAGFGLRTMLEVQRKPNPVRQGDHLMSTKGVFLGNPSYIAPEQVQGQPIDARTDLYSLGIILFELLSGTLPFNGTDPLEIAQQRLYGIIPSIHSRQPQMPEELEVVVRKMLDLDPNKRYQRASEAALAFENTLNVLNTSQRASIPKPMPKTIPPTSNWFDASEMSRNNPALGQSAPIPAMPYMQGPAQANPNAHPAPAPAMPYMQGPAQANPNARLVSATALERMQQSAQADQHARSLEGMDPFEWWSTQSSGNLPALKKADTSSSPLVKKADTSASPFVRKADTSSSPLVKKADTSASPFARKAGTFAQQDVYYADPPAQDLPRSRSVNRGRRKLVTTIVAGSAVSVATVASLSFVHLLQSMKQAPAQSLTANTTGQNATKSATTVTKSGQTAATPTRKVTVPQDPGTKIGTTTLAKNSSLTFTNPKDGVSSLLIHLSTGQFVACERTCTHQGVPVNYDPASGMLVCPAHGAVFNPKNGFSHVSGPGQGPLTAVKIQTNADGAVTAI